MKIFRYLAFIALGFVGYGLYDRYVSSSDSQPIGNFFSNPERTSWISDSEFDTRNIGTAKMLNNSKTLIYTVYTIQDGYPLTENDMNRYNIAVHAAGKWITTQCAAHGINHSFTYARRRVYPYRFPSSVDLNHSSGRKLVEHVFGPHYRDTIARIRTRDLGYHDNIIISFCTSQSGCSHAWSDNQDLYRSNHYDYPEVALININGKGSLESIITHEFLHCFGAWDLYERDDVMFYRGAAAPYKEKLDNSVMCRTNRPLSQLRIDELTAYLTGMSSTFYDWFPVIMKAKLK